MCFFYFQIFWLTQRIPSKLSFRLVSAVPYGGKVSQGPFLLVIIFVIIVRINTGANGAP